MIWVVTDESRTKDELLPLVESRGYTASHIDCVSDVPKRAKFQCPALIIIDCNVKDSFTLVSEIRSDPQLMTIPLVMFTTSKDDHRDEALARGADGFVVKRSLDWADLLHEINRLAGAPPGNARAE